MRCGAIVYHSVLDPPLSWTTRGVLCFSSALGRQVKWVSYAGLPSSPYHQLGKQYCPRGTSSLFTFGIHGGYQAGVELVEGCTLLSHLANLGDARSLILHPASTTHRQLTDEQRSACGAGDDVIRLSIGLESPEDLITDLSRALDCVT